MNDISDTIREIQNLLGSTSFDVYAESWAMQRATERGLEIISESSRHLPDDLKTRNPDIPWRQIAAIGNLLRHEYQRADPLAIWNIVKEHLPGLARVADQLLKETRNSEAP